MALASGDFDGDGHADLAVGAPGSLQPDAAAPGAVVILYGTSEGLASQRSQRWSPADLLPSDDADPRVGAALASADFDGDGYADLAIGAPSADVDEIADDGVVVVLAGGPDGLGDRELTTLRRSETGIVSASGTWFGDALAAGDLDGDGYADLAVGAPVADSWHGAVGVFYGSTDGLATSRSQAWEPGNVGVGWQAGTEDRLGSSLAIGDLDADGHGDLAIGAPGACPAPCGRAEEGAGVVVLLYGTAIGLSADRSQLWSKGTDGVPGTAGQFDAFGKSLAAGDLDCDGTADLAVGVSGWYVQDEGGAVILLRGGPTGLRTRGAQRLTLDRLGFAADTEAEFGEALSIADHGRTSCADLAIGAPGVAAGGGSIVVVYGARAGLDVRAAERWSQDTPGVPGSTEPADRFGDALLP